MKARAFLPVTMCVVLGTTAACTQATPEKTARKPMSQAQIAQIMGPGKEQVALLAAKADVDEAIVNDILTQYLKKHDFAYAVFANADGALKNSGALALDPEANGRIGDTVREMAGRHNISATKVAALIVDYRTWRACVDRVNP